jgi:nucleoside 2-deoxyribosyltransferase
MSKVYLSGPIESSPDSGSGWRQVAQERLEAFGYTVFNPVIASGPLLKEYGFLDHDDYRKTKMLIQDSFVAFQQVKRVTEAFIKQDLEELKSSDLVLVYMDKHFSGGTAGELTVAKDLGIPVIACCHEELSNISSWMLACTDYVFFLKKSLESTPLEEALQLFEVWSKNIDG